MQMARAGVPSSGGVVWNDPDLANASYDSIVFDPPQTANPYAVCIKPDGAKLYILGNRFVHQYTLTTPYDLSTITYDNVSLSLGHSSTDFDISMDGTKLYAINLSIDSIYQYTMSAAYDVSSATYDSVSFSIASQDTNPHGVHISPNGEKLFMLGLNSDRVYQYTMSTPFDLSTTSYDSVSFSVSSQESTPLGITFNPDGTKMYICGYQQDRLFQYSLSSAFDVSTASYDSINLYMGGQDAFPVDIEFSSDGSKMYMVGLTTDNLYQYSTA
jgi:hypothetical protein